MCVLLALACTGVGGSKDAADDSTPSEADADADVDPGPVDPIILSFSTNTSEIDPTDTVSFSVIVSDPQGIDDLIGGQLIDPGGGTYGTFSTASEEGAYSLSLGWSRVNTVRTIDFEAGSSENRTFRAQFYDAEGNSATDDLSVRLSCARSDEGACDGECTPSRSHVEPMMAQQFGPPAAPGRRRCVGTHRGVRAPLAGRRASQGGST